MKFLKLQILTTLCCLLAALSIHAQGTTACECMVQDVSGSYVAPPLILITDSNNGDIVPAVDLSGMAVGECFWDWPTGLYVISLAQPAKYSLSSFCNVRTLNSYTSSILYNTSASASTTYPSLGLNYGSGIGYPNYGWFPTGPTFPIGYVCRYE